MSIPSDEFEELLIFDLYGLLSEECRKLFGNASAPSLSEPDSPSYLPPSNGFSLLPVYDGWWLKPGTKHGPLRLRPTLREENSIVHLLHKKANDRYTYSDLHEIEDGISKRSWSLGIQHRTLGILTAAIEQAERDLDDSYNEPGVTMRILRKGKTPRGVKVKSMEFFDPQDVKRIDLWRRKQQFYRLRLDWLRRWKRVAERRRKGVLREEISSAKPFNYSALIKPEDLHEAYGQIDDCLGRPAPGESQFKRLGQWYSEMLWKYGATWRDLLAIRRSNSKKDWTAIAEKKYQNYKAYKQKQERQKEL